MGPVGGMSESLNSRPSGGPVADPVAQSGVEAAEQDARRARGRLLRGKCREMSDAAAAADPTLEVVRGWYHDPVWGTQEHWWNKRPDGTILDLTAEQFPVGGMTWLYEEFTGTFPCYGCGDPVSEDDQVNGCCSGPCYASMVGVPY